MEYLHTLFNTVSSLFTLLALFLLLSSSIPVVHASLPGPRSATVSGDVFLGGDFIELGLSQYGSFGTNQSEALRAKARSFPAELCLVC